jgi:hypothetical protein
MTDVNSDHRVTLEQIFRHPASANIEWRRVRSLLETVGSAAREHDGKFEVTVGGVTKVFQPPHGKDVDVQMIVDLRHFLTEAGITPAGH